MTPVELQSILQTAAMAVANVVPEALERESAEDLLHGPVPLIGSGLQLALAAFEHCLELQDEELQHLAAMARWEVRGLLNGLVGLSGESGAERILSSLGQARRTVLASLDAVDERLSELTGQARRLAHLSEVESERHRVLARMYDEFRREVEAVGEPDDASLPANLIQIALRLERLVAGDGAVALPIEERLHVRRLQRRIDSWLTGEDGWQPSSARRLWMDLAAFAELLVRSRSAA